MRSNSIFPLVESTKADHFNWKTKGFAKVIVWIKFESDHHNFFSFLVTRLLLIELKFKGRKLLWSKTAFSQKGDKSSIKSKVYLLFNDGQDAAHHLTTRTHEWQVDGGLPYLKYMTEVHPNPWRCCAFFAYPVVIEATSDARGMGWGGLRPSLI